MMRRTTKFSACFFVFFFKILLPSHSQAINSSYLLCAPLSYSCGSTDFIISYPFQVDSRPDYCSYPGYHLNCTDINVNKNSSVILTITINNHDYQVNSINYTNKLLSIVPTDLIQRPCPQPYNGYTIDMTLFQYSDHNRNLTLYINCTTLASPLPGVTDIGCLNGTEGQRSYYSLNSRPNYEWSSRCITSTVVPLTQKAADNLVDGRLGFGQAMQQGFFVKWTRGRETDWCGDCVRSGGYCGYNSSDVEQQVCFCRHGTFTGSCDSSIQIHGQYEVRRKLIIGAFGILAGFLIGSVFFVLWFRSSKTMSRVFCWKKNSRHAQTIEVFLEKYDSLATKRYTYSSIKKITKSFSEKLGQGGFGSVYKGKLFDGHLVAVKILSETKGNGEDFINEVAAIGNTSHVNVVSLRGFCCEGSKRALIYDYMPNGSLEKYIYFEELKKEASLGWEKLYEIAIGIARGLEYLHRGCSTRIVHFDIKPHNILLDQDFCPKISDFGMAKLCPPKQSIISMYGARGTIGYIAPEVFSRTFGAVSSKSDVYSYGMLLLEMFGSKNKVHTRMESASDAYFPQSIYRHLESHKDDLDLAEYGVTNDNEETARKMMVVGFWCIQTMPENRPTTSRMVEMLEASVNDLPIPPKPTLSSPFDLIAVTYSSSISESCG